MKFEINNPNNKRKFVTGHFLNFLNVLEKSSSLFAASLAKLMSENYGESGLLG